MSVSGGAIAILPLDLDVVGNVVVDWEDNVEFGVLFVLSFAM